MIAILFVLSVVGLTVAGLVFAEVKELHDYGYSWGYSFLRVLGGLR